MLRKALMNPLTYLLFVLTYEDVLVVNDHALQKVLSAGHILRE